VTSHAWAALAKDGESVMCILVHSIDGPELRNDRAQEAIALLAERKRIRIVGTVDHVNAPLCKRDCDWEARVIVCGADSTIVWDQRRRAQCRWVWHHVPTWQRYTVEAQHQVNMLTKEKVHGAVVCVLRGG
jgi:origin recognition complex subunit 2